MHEVEALLLTIRPFGTSNYRFGEGLQKHTCPALSAPWHLVMDHCMLKSRELYNVTTGAQGNRQGNIIAI